MQDYLNTTSTSRKEQERNDAVIAKEMQDYLNTTSTSRKEQKESNYKKAMQIVLERKKRRNDAK